MIVLGFFSLDSGGGVLFVLFSYFWGDGAGVMGFVASCLFIMGKHTYIIKNLVPELKFSHQEDAL